MSSGRIPIDRRRRVAEASSFRCGYCLTAQRVIGPLLEIDHIVPEAHGGTDEETNLTLACPLCNSDKADRIASRDPESGVVTPLFNPRLQRWAEHFRWVENGTVVEGISTEGRATVAALVMNHPDIVEARVLWVDAGWHPPTDVAG